MTTPAYAEIGITTNFSFLRGGSDPRAYVHQASILGIPVIGIADHNTLAGVVRAYKELDNDKVLHKPKLLIGARIVFIDGTPDISGLSARPRRLWPAVSAPHQRQARRRHHADREGRMPSHLR
ncbi:DNA polymerase III alpha subunit [Bradyrhizobium barranii subsp. barranii]